MRSRKYWVMGATAALVMVSSPAIAAELSNANGQSCGDAMGVWHFVNNQTGGAAPGTLNATFSDGTVWNVAPSAVNQNVQHFYVSSTGTLVSATTTLPGRLVLSDFSCEDVKKK
ncbi:hypothetical protein [Nocardioides ganghwensis]|jgi:hypothetical protein|uniref:Secreted protein n=1 Tax=Nocardioides ganghwensis TaxID=252230 RepID=A0A4Q2SDH9_9ACTN|nr:hypothetical protein [Nocardioides ganghwensis]MBD3946871.1 hypothetical protein [Nocardioides ganghwensis]RYC02781.1 hypothetical protein EUA07_08580 [Nocardioides ganghwensis]